MAAYYNENEPYAAAWLRNLVARGLIAPGDVDDRSIVDVHPDDLRGYFQCHFFAGIGGWSYALRLAGWGDERPVWTGSCPCQPFSSAGRRKADADERHLWPAFCRLIAERRPAAVFGEQVTGKLGREWLAGVRADLEDAGYAVGGADLPAAGVGAIRLADARGQRRQGGARRGDFQPAEFGRAGFSDRGGMGSESGRGAQSQRDGRAAQELGRLCNLGALADAKSIRSGRSSGAGRQEGSVDRRGDRGLGDADKDRRGSPRDARPVPEERDPQPHGGGMGDASLQGLPASERQNVPGSRRREEGRAAAESGAVRAGELADVERGRRMGAGDDEREHITPGRPGGTDPLGQWQFGEGGVGGLADPATGQLSEPLGRPEGRDGARSTRPGFWDGAEWLQCVDGKTRRAQPGIFPLASGVPNRVGQLRAAGNAICPQAAAAFIHEFAALIG